MSDTPLGEKLKYAVDVRWATDRSVYLALKKAGVVELRVDTPQAQPVELIPGEKASGGFWISQHLGASAQYLVTAAPLFALTWRSLASPVRKNETFEGIDDLDVHGNRLAVAGVRRDSQGSFSPDGAIAWIGSLDRGLADLKPLVFDAGGPGAPTAARCGLLFLGATRFLADESLLVMPGIQPGISRFDAQGKLVQSVDTVALGIDTDCASVTPDLKSQLARHTTQRMAWINERRVVDDVLPLPSGPGLLVRSFEHGQVQWRLKVVHPNGSVSVYSVPAHAKTPFAHLKGDLREGRLVLLLWEYSADGQPDGAPLPHLLTATPPGA